MKYKLALLGLVLAQTIGAANAQVLTGEDSLTAGLVAKEQATILSGYGEAHYSYDLKRKNSEATLKRVVLFVGHKFNKKISLFTELEVEDAVAVGQVGDEGEAGKGGISMEQAFLKFNARPNIYVVAGLFIPRLGIINENHLPTTFNGVERPKLEEMIIPSTWREIGVGIYGSSKNLPGFNYSFSLTNGLNSAAFTSGTGIRNGRQLGSRASGFGLAISGSALYYINNFRIQASGYIGGSTSVEKRVADSLGLESGPFGNSVKLGEVNLQYANNGWTGKVIGTYVNIGNANNINSAYANNTPNSIYGGYAEAAYNLLYKKYGDAKAVYLFARYEYINLSATLPKNGIQNDANQQKYIIAGITYKPIRGIAIKFDYTHRTTGEPNLGLVVTPFPQLTPYYTSNGFLNLGVAYNF